MTEYIEREAAIQSTKHAWAKGLKPSQYIEIIPSADVTPVQHGQWNVDGIYVICSVCNKPTLSPIVKQLPTFKYCPNCGAKMYKEESTMSESLEYIAQFTEWLEKEPTMLLFWRWKKWKRERPVWKEV